MEIFTSCFCPKKAPIPNSDQQSGDKVDPANLIPNSDQQSGDKVDRANPGHNHNGCSNNECKLSKTQELIKLDFTQCQEITGPKK